jgi:hypothetical protein
VAGDAALTRAERIQFASTAVMGFGWTVAIFTYAPTGGLEFRLLLAAIIAGMGAGAVPKLVGASPHIEIFIGLLSVPVIPVCVMAGSSMDYVIAVGAVLYMYGVLESARHLRAALVTSTRLGLERLSLLASTREALARSENASKVKSEFLANMSHEIRTRSTPSWGSPRSCCVATSAPGRPGSSSASTRRPSICWASSAASSICRGSKPARCTSTPLN